MKWKLVPIEPTEEMLNPIAHARWPEDWEAGKKLQASRLQVPPVCELEVAVGQYQRAITASPSPLEDGELVERVKAALPQLLAPDKDIMWSRLWSNGSLGLDGELDLDQFARSILKLLYERG